jgi:hypothetical protein
MILYWFVLAWRFLLRLVRPVSARDVAQINQNAPCPVCGARRGKLRAVRQVVSTTTFSLSVACQHECQVCGARFYEAPVVKLDAARVMGAVGFDDPAELGAAKPASMSRAVMR